MLARFDKHIQTQKLFTKNQSLLLAVSGGIDSVVLAHLLTQLKYKIVLAHCNFNLRGKESDEDETFCRKLAKKLHVNIYVQSFDIKKYCKVNKVSIQMAARELRYAWFKELVEKNNYDFILTAHHLDDSVETILLNIIRGTGLKGLVGIQEKNNKIIRPLLAFKKSEIKAFAKLNKIEFRTDKTNADDKYKRNFVRLNLIPKIKQLNPIFDETLMRSALNMQHDQALLTEFVDFKKKSLIHETGKSIIIKIQQILEEKNCLAILKHLLQDYHFNNDQTEDVYVNIVNAGLKGKQIKSQSHTLYISQKELVIITNTKSNIFHHVFENLDDLKKCSLFKLEVEAKFKIPKSDELIIDSNKLIFPMVLRNKNTGDKFKPFGMKGFKLLSDFFKEQKLNSLQKKEVKILVNGNGEIIWIINYRSDERYRVNEKASNLIKIKYCD